MDAMLLKPFDRASLLGVLASVVPKDLGAPTPTTGDPRVSDPAAPTPYHAAPVLDPAPLRAMAGRRTPDGPLVDRLLVLFAEHVPRYVADLRASADPFDKERFRLAAHTLRSNAASLG